MKEDLIEDELFGNEAGEDETPEVLDSYFVEKNEFARFYSPKNKFLIVQAKKGVGKSALLKNTLIKENKRDKNSIYIYIKGSDLVSLKSCASFNPHELVNTWQQRICARINLEIGSRLQYAFTDSSITLVESSEIAGFRQRNIVGLLLDRLKSKKLFERSKPIPSDSFAFLERHANDNSINVWLMVDDIDATFINTEENRVSISTFFSACRNIASKVNGLIIRASVRKDVWPLLAQNDEALDKCEQYMVDLRWSTKETGDILCSKILSYFQRAYPSDSTYQEMSLSSATNRHNILNLVFTRKFVCAHGISSA